VPSGKINWIYLKPWPKPVITGEGEKTKAPLLPHENLPEFKLARDKFMPAIIYFYCSDKNLQEAKYCHKLNAKVFTADEVVNNSKKFVCFAIDTVKLHKTIASAFAVRSAPLMIIMDCFGNTLNRLPDCQSMSPAALEKIMVAAIKKNLQAVKKFDAEAARKKAELEALQDEFDKADKLMDQGKFNEAKAVYQKISENKINKDLADYAGLRIIEIGMGVTYFEAMKALDEGRFDDAEAKLRAVAKSRSDRYSDKAAALLEEFPAARLYREALDLLKVEKNFEAMQKLEKILELDGAEAYKEKANLKLKEIKESWNKKVK
jgi:tetratricopeptide (TPR) repeat protein